MKKVLKNKEENFIEYIDLQVEIDTEKKVLYITNKSYDNEGVAKRYKNKKDIMRIFGNYLFKKVYIYPPKDER